jgi:CTP:molybdopterin cytidylyltransferase MocA
MTGGDAGLLLAAGEGRRFGGPKQLAPLHGRPLLEHALAALAAELERVVVVLGARAEEIRRGADLGRAEVVVCPDWEEGMAASVRCGLAALAGAGRVLVAPADQPGLTPAAVRAVLERPGSARAVYAGRPGHPVVLGPELLARAGELRGDAGFRDLLAGVPEVECGHLGRALDIDTREDLEMVER